MGKPSIFSNNYKQQLKKRRLNTILFILLVLCIGFFGGKYYLDKNNLSLATEIKNNKMIQASRIPDMAGWVKDKVTGLFGAGKDSDKNSPQDEDNQAPAGSTGSPVTDQEPLATVTATVSATLTPVTTSPPLPQATEQPATTGEYEYLAKNGYRFGVVYSKTQDKVEITGLKETSGTSEYCISQDKSMIVFDVKQDNSIILCDATGVFKMLSRDKYKSTTSGKIYEKATVLKTYDNYIWAQKPYFTMDNRVVYISRIPYFKSSKMLYMWSVSLDGKTHKRISKVGLNLSKVSFQGYDEQNRLKVTADGKNYLLNIGSYMLRENKVQ